MQRIFGPIGVVNCSIRYYFTVLKNGKCRLGEGGILDLKTYSDDNFVVHILEQRLPLKIKYQFLFYAVYFFFCYLKRRYGFEFILGHQTTPHRTHKV